MLYNENDWHDCPNFDPEDDLYDGFSRATLYGDDGDPYREEWDELIAEYRMCKKYRKEYCNGCPYYSPEDQVCRFDK